MKNETYIAVLLDRSGSMSSVKSDTIGGYNEFVDEQHRAGDNCRLTLVQFDSQAIDTVHENLPIREVPHLTNATFKPRDMTPLLDALGETIVNTGRLLKGIKEEDRPDKVVFVIITDGEENASKRYTKAQIKEMIQHQTDVYKWAFVYIGANQDAFAEARSLGIGADFATNYKGSKTKSAFAATSSNLTASRLSGNLDNLKYKSAQRKVMVDDEPEKF